MKLPAFRLSALRNGRGFRDVVGWLRHQLLGTVQLLPAALGRAEYEELLDAYALFLDLPLRFAAHMPVTAGTSLPSELGAQGDIVVLTEPVEREPEAWPEGIIVCTGRRVPGERHLDLPRGVMLLRDAVTECLGPQLHGTRLGRLASWLNRATDSPGTASHFVDGVWARHLSDPEADDKVLFSAGLAASIGWLLQGVDPRVAEWILVLALAMTTPERAVGTDAALLGREAALQRAYVAGLIHNLEGEGAEERLDLRRPLAMLGQLGEMPGAPAVEDILAALEEYLQPEVWERVRRPFERSKPSLGLGLRGPSPPRILFGRTEIIERLVTLLEPADEMRTVVLYGLGGIGKTTVAAAVAERLGHRLEAVWVSFASGPEAGWRRVAMAMEVDFRRPALHRLDAVGVPRWVREVQERLCRAPCLLVIDEVDEVPESELPLWLPHGEGRAAMLVLSRTVQPRLGRTHEAIAVALAPPSIWECRQLLASRVSSRTSEILAGQADGLIQHLGHHPLALELIAPLLEHSSIEELLQRLRLGEVGQERVREALKKVMVGATEAEQLFLGMLSVFPSEGGPMWLAHRITEGKGTVSVNRLVERSLILQEGALVRLHPLLRSILELRLDSTGKRSLIERGHAAAVVELVDTHRREQAVWEEGLYENLLLAAERAAKGCASGEGEWFDLGIWLSSALLSCSAGDLGENRKRVIELCESMRMLVSKDSDPPSWARTQILLGGAWSKLPSGDRCQNLQQAIAAFEQVVQVFPCERDPGVWAKAQVGLSYALTALPTGDRTMNSERAVAAAEAALTVLTREQSPNEWVNAQAVLGMALMDRKAGRRADNYRQAIAVLEAALEAASEPIDRANIQSQLAKACTRLAAEIGGDAEYLQRAVHLAEEALEVLTPKNDPENWARCQNHLGRALAALPTGDRTENLRRAIAAHEAALSCFTQEDFPWKWARTHRYLGRALAALPTGDRAENLRRALAAYRNAATVLTADAFPSEAQQIEDDLKGLLEELSRLQGDRLQGELLARPRASH